MSVFWLRSALLVSLVTLYPRNSFAQADVDRPEALAINYLADLRFEDAMEYF